MDIDLSELNSLTVDLGKAGEKALPLARRVIQKSAADIKRDAQVFAPVDTGNLRSSIGYETHELASAVTAEIGPTASYGHFVEFGTSRMGPHAYMGPALDRNGYSFEKAMAAVAKALDL
ncbi:MAG TPA: HK97-gp10 family putative phage morphogenesis protein [Intrasporangium sp.]|uniref:HK97-gp10 family putative phage morphogenesis protein n=1 Tax=Intrasporangium sp. TaxID=1925024 RepID=UPI002D795873|nr:HK97-gp10 family putative phage morphogenesis protein [Intrasporangium sp.]HET7398992.1 HK97-gp10 family putative phage morphogenesis protein [Intrasporangium sp.]